MSVRQPAIFLPHGGGPCFWMEFPPPFGPRAWDGLRDYLAGLVSPCPSGRRRFWSSPRIGRRRSRR